MDAVLLAFVFLLAALLVIGYAVWEIAEAAWPLGVRVFVAVAAVATGITLFFWLYFLVLFWLDPLPFN